MKLVDYVCDETNERIELDVGDLNTPPASVEQDGKIFTRVWAVPSGGILIPLDWNRKKLNFDARPSKKKVFY